MAANEAHYLAHVGVVVSDQFRLRLAQNFNYPAPARVTDALSRFPIGALPSDAPAFIGFEPFVQVSRGHVDGILEIAPNLLQIAQGTFFRSSAAPCIGRTNSRLTAGQRFCASFSTLHTIRSTSPAS